MGTRVRSQIYELPIMRLGQLFLPLHTFTYCVTVIIFMPTYINVMKIKLASIFKSLRDRKIKG